jgi:hypothetical protein
VLNPRAGARVVIASDDHCAPHARHKEEGWVVRLWFSFASAAVGVMSIAPTESAVRQRQLNHLRDKVVTALRACRKKWWESKHTTCLENKWVARISAGDMEVLSERPEGARQVRSARYDETTCGTALIFSDRTEESIANGGDKWPGGVLPTQIMPSHWTPAERPPKARSGHNPFGNYPSATRLRSLPLATAGL